MKKFLLIFAAAALVALCGCSVINNNWIISIDGTKIDKSEFAVYLYEQVKAFEETGGSDIWAVDFDGVSAQEVAKQNAANSLLRAKLAVKEAAGLGVSGEVDENSVKTEGQSLYDSITSDTLGRIALDDITPELCENIIRDGLIQQQVYQAVTSSYEINRQDFETYLKDYYNKNIALYKNITVKAIYVAADPSTLPLEGKEPTIDEYSDTNQKYVAAEGRERIEEAYALLKDGERFGRVQYDYSQDPNRREFSVNQDMYNEDVLAKIYALDKDEYTDIIEYGDGYYIFYAKDVSQTPIESVSPEIEQIYSAEKKEEIYQAQNDSWQNAADIKRNSTVWESIVINADTAEEVTVTVEG